MRHAIRWRAEDRGFTLIEVGVAIVLFSMVLLAAGGVLTAPVAGISYPRAKAAADSHLQRQVARIYGTEYAQLASGKVDTTLASGVALRFAWTVTELVPNELKRADMTVRVLTDSSGRADRSVRLFVANRER